MAGAGSAGAVLQVDLGAVAANWRLLAGRATAAECGAVVKADGYGLGALPMAQALAAAGCRTFFVAHLDEGLALRRSLPHARVVLLLGVPVGAEGDAAGAGLIPTLNDPGAIARWRAAAARAGRPLPAMVHLDTGMNRLGLSAADAARLRADPGLLSGVAVQAWISHLACADQAGSAMTRQQAEQFDAMLAGLPVAAASLANSSGHFRGAGLIRDLTRPGCALYGINPTPEAANPMRPVVRLLGRILQVRRVDPPAAVGYGATHRLKAPATIATIAIGYADGYHRTLGSRGHVLIGGVEAPVVGRISMDLMTVDASLVPPALLERSCWAEVIGTRSIDQVAAEAGTIGYEILTGFGPRVRRLYHGQAT